MQPQANRIQLSVMLKACGRRACLSNDRPVGSDYLVNSPATVHLIGIGRSIRSSPLASIRSALSHSRSQLYCRRLAVAHIAVSDIPSESRLFERSTAFSAPLLTRLCS